MNWPFNISLLLFCLIQTFWAYEIPIPTIKVYRKGFQVLIPHELGIDNVIFNGKLYSEAGSCDGTPCQGIFTLWGTAWVYNNVDAEPQLGDALFYSIQVRKNRKTYSKQNRVYSIENYAEIATIAPSTSVFDQISNNRASNSSFRVYRKGFEVSIPHREGITFVFTSIIFGPEFKQHVCNIINAPDENRRWTLKNSEVEIQLGDTVNYFIWVYKNGVLANEENVSFVVESYAEPNTQIADPDETFQ